MKILLQHTRTLQYLRTAESWTRTESDARNFLHSQKAIDFAHEHNLENVYIAVKFPGGNDDVVVPLPAFRPTIVAPTISAQA